MDQTAAPDGFYDTLPRIASFADLTLAESYRSLPDDWVLGCADIVDSTKAIAEGRYKTVNAIGAAVISAQINASDGRAFPYVFGGDGASFACAPEHGDIAGRALAAVQRWADEEFGLGLRTALVPVRAVRDAGHDIAVARYQAAPGVDYAMFSGGGLSWAERQMKAGRFALLPAPPGTQPDLTGLSCRWSNLKAQNGTILSVVVEPAEAANEADFAAVARELVAVADRLSRGGHPVPASGPPIRWPPPGMTLDAHMSRRRMSLTLRRLQLLYENLLAFVFFKTGLKAGEFDPVHYARTVSDNADFRKFDDGLKMTLDCDSGTVDHLRGVLDRAQDNGIVRYGLFQQDEAMVTCIVPSITRDDHVHFIDGAAGGYTRAAAQIKAGQGVLRSGGGVTPA